MALACGAASASIWSSYRRQYECSNYANLSNMSYLIKLLAATLLGGSSAFAHEFWIQATPFHPAAGQQMSLTLHVGEYFTGELVGVTAQHAASVKLLSATGAADLMGKIPTDSMHQALRVTAVRPGTHILAYDSRPSEVVLSADKFHAYLHEEGLDEIIRQREAAGTALEPGRERFRRHAKSIFRVGGQSDRTSVVATGQRFELVPLTDPFARGEEGRLRMELRYEGKPLAGVLVKAWHKRGEQTTVLRTRSDQRGAVNFDLPYSGPWMLNAVHMVRVSGVPNIEWESLWSSLTFELPPRKRD